MSDEEIKSDESSDVVSKENKKSFLQRIKDWLGFNSKEEDKHEE